MRGPVKDDVIKDSLACMFTGVSVCHSGAKGRTSTGFLFAHHMFRMSTRECASKRMTSARGRLSAPPAT